MHTALKIFLLLSIAVGACGCTLARTKILYNHTDAPVLLGPDQGRIICDPGHEIAFSLLPGWKIWSESDQWVHEDIRIKHEQDKHWTRTGSCLRPSYMIRYQIESDGTLYTLPSGVRFPADVTLLQDSDYVYRPNAKGAGPGRQVSP